MNTPRYFNRHTGEWADIPGKVYIASLALALSHPQTLARRHWVHRDLDNPKRWAVTDAGGGFRIATGKTRAEALSTAAYKIGAITDAEYIARAEAIAEEMMRITGEGPKEGER